MKLIYIAGPYRGKTREAVELNIATARRVALLIAQAGHMPVIPHANTAGFEHLDPDIPDQFWLDGTLALMLKCDAVVLCPGWDKSSGTLAEIRKAVEHDIGVYGSANDFINGVRAL